jgi:hypothetical protein
VFYKLFVVLTWVHGATTEGSALFVDLCGHVLHCGCEF